MPTDKSKTRRTQQLLATLASEKSMRFVLYVMLFAVALWVRVNSFDSAIVKPFLFVAFSTLLLAMYASHGLRVGRIEWTCGGMDIAVSIFVLLSLLGMILSPLKEQSIAAVQMVTATAICYFAGKQLFHSLKNILHCIDLLITLGGIVAGFGIFQFFFPDSIGLDFQIGTIHRVMSTMGNATFFAGFLTSIMMLAVGRLITEEQMSRRLISGISLVLMSTALFLSQTRSSLIAVAVSVVFLVLFLGKSRRGLMLRTGIVLGAVGLAAWFLMPGLERRIVETVSTGHDISIERRIVFWKAGAEALWDAPLTGHGPGSHEFAVSHYREAGYWTSGSEDIVPHAHNVFLEVAVELGIPGLLAFVTILGIIARNSWVLIRSQSGIRSEIAAPFFFSLLATLLDNLTGVSLLQPPIAMVTALQAGLLTSSAFQREPSTISLKLPPGGLVSSLPLLVWFAAMTMYVQTAFARIEADAMLLRGLLTAKGGNQSAASVHFRSAYEKNPMNLVAALNLGISLLKMEKEVEGLSVIRSLKSTAPDYPKSSLLEALALMGLDNLESAHRAIREEIGRRDHPEAYFTEALILSRMHDTTSVKIALEKVVERNIAAHVQVHLEDACRTLLEIAKSDAELYKLSRTMKEIVAMFPQSEVYREILLEVRRRVESRRVILPQTNQE